MSTDIAKLIELTGPHCEESQPWFAGKSFDEAWASCERGDWGLKFFAGMVGQPGWPTHQQVVSVACDCIEPVVSEFTNLTLDTIRRWTSGEATAEDVLITEAQALSAAQIAKLERLTAMAARKSREVQRPRSAAYAADAVFCCCQYIADGDGITAACIAWDAALASGNPRQSLKVSADLIKEKFQSLRMGVTK